MGVNKVVFGKTTVIDLSGLTVEPDKLLSGVTAMDASGEPITGTMPNRGALSGKIATKSGAATIPEGYHNGSGTVSIDTNEQNKIISENIKKGVTILGVSGKSTVVDTETAAGGIYAGKVMDGYVGYVNGNKITGTVADYSWGENVTGSPKNLTYVSNEDGYATFRVVNTGLYSSGSSATRLRFNLADQGVIASNIVSGKTVLGVTGTASSGMKTVTGTCSSGANGQIVTLGTFSAFPKYILLQNGSYGIWGELNANGTSYTFHASNATYSGSTTTVYESKLVIAVNTPWANVNLSYIAFFE